MPYTSAFVSSFDTPVHRQFGPNIRIHSGYRSAAVNKLVGGSATSQHSKGEAVDFSVRGMTNYDLACWLRDNLRYDQLILEHFLPSVPGSGWVHCSFSRTLRGISMTKFKFSKKYHEGILLTEPGAKTA